MLSISLCGYANAFITKQDSSYTIAQAKNMAKKGIRVSRNEIKGYKKAFDDCSFTNQYYAAARLKKYPYATAYKIMAVSYYGGGEPNTEIRLDNKPVRKLTYKQKQHYKGLVITNKQLDYSTLIETKTLNPQQIEELTNLLFNYEFTGLKGYTFTGTAACFYPRNSIIFFDKEGKIFDHLDICFNCHRYDSASGKLDVGTECAQKFDMLAKFFIKAGVRYGSDKTVPLN